jgi:hypothetical protein
LDCSWKTSSVELATESCLTHSNFTLRSNPKRILRFAKHHPVCGFRCSPGLRLGLPLLLFRLLLSLLHSLLEFLPKALRVEGKVAEARRNQDGGKAKSPSSSGDEFHFWSSLGVVFENLLTRCAKAPTGASIGFAQP